MRVVVTGGAGFIGSNFIGHVLSSHPDWDVTNLDKLTYAGNLENLKDVQDDPRYRFVRGNIADCELVNELLSAGCDAIVNFAAESHVDRCIMDASPFIDTNINGTKVLLEACRQHGIEKFIQVSTDEVYGSIEQGSFSEHSPLRANNLYSASKASADLLCLAYWRTYGVPVTITRCSNNFGPYQFPEKLIPLVISNAIEDRPIPVYGDGLNVRDWIFVQDHCRALEMVVERGTPGEVYNIGSGNEKTNLELIHTLLHLLDKPRDLIQFVADRPGHDRRYALDTGRIGRELGWTPVHPFEGAIVATVEWYRQNEAWWRRIKSGEYAAYYERMYLHR